MCLLSEWSGATCNPSRAGSLHLGGEERARPQVEKESYGNQGKICWPNTLAVASRYPPQAPRHQDFIKVWAAGALSAASIFLHKPGQV